MCRTVLHLLTLVAHSWLSLAFCPKHQKAFRSSCYEFVGIQRSFFSAQAWCEQIGGHLAFIPDEDTQYFLQRHLDPEKDVWFGVAPSASTNLQYSPTAEGKKKEKGQTNNCYLKQKFQNLWHKVSIQLNLDVRRSLRETKMSWKILLFPYHCQYARISCKNLHITKVTFLQRNETPLTSSVV